MFGTEHSLFLYRLLGPNPAPEPEAVPSGLVALHEQTGLPSYNMNWRQICPFPEVSRLARQHSVLFICKPQIKNVGHGALHRKYSRQILSQLEEMLSRDIVTTAVCHKNNLSF